MNKIYKLLRNNRQQGPYSLEELQQQDLKPFDLVWVDGKSAGWRYPSEITELISLLPSSDLRPVAPDPARTPEQKPAVQNRKHIYVSLPGQTVAVPSRHVKEPRQPEKTAEPESTESFEERVERMRQRVAAVEAGSMQQGEEDAIETKYTRSLDDIKQEYSSWLRSQKVKRSLPVSGKMLAGSGVALALIVAILFITRSGGSSPQSPSSVLPSTSLGFLTAQKEKLNEEPLTAKVVSTPIWDRLDRTLAKTGSKKSSGKKPSKKSGAAKSGTVAKEKKAPKGLEEQKAVPKSSPSLAAKLQLKGNLVPARKGVGGMELLLKNNSHELIRTVAVDMAYHQNGEVIKRTTIYFSNIPPGGSQTNSVPAHKKATAISYQMGLISASSGGLYVGM